MRRVYRRSLAGLGTVLLGLFLVLVALLFAGNWGSSLASRVVRNYLSTFPLNVTFGELTGNLASGYEVTDLSIKTKKGIEALRVHRLRVGLASFVLSPLDVGLDVTVQGVRSRESALGELAVEARAAFPLSSRSTDESSRIPLTLGTIRLEDWQGLDQPWALKKLTLLPRAGGSGLTGTASWQGRPVGLTGTVGRDLNDPSADLSIGFLGAILSVKGKMSSGFDVKLSGLRLASLADLAPSLRNLALAGTASLDATFEPGTTGWVAAGDLRGSGLSAMGSVAGNLNVPFAFDGRVASVKGLTGRIFGGTLSGHMKLDTGDRAFPLSLGLVLAGADVSKAPSLLQTNVGLGLRALNVALNGPLAALSGRASFSGGRANWHGLEASNLKGAADFKVGTVRFDLSGGLLGGRIKAAGMVGSQIDGTASLSGADLSRLGVLAPDAKLKGRVTVEARVSGSVDAPAFAVEARGTSLGAIGATIDGLDARATGTLREVVLERFSARLFGGSLLASGRMTDLESPTGRLDVKLGGFSAVGLKAGWPANPIKELNPQNGGTFALTLTAGKPDARAVYQIPSLTAGGVDVQNAHLEATFADGRLTVRRLDGQLLGGSVSSSGTVTLEEAGPVLDLRGKAENLSLNELDVPLSGTVSGSWTVHGPAEKPVVDLRLAAPRLTVERLMLTDCSLAASGFGTYDVRFSARNLGAPLLAGGGTVTLPAAGDPGSVDLSVRLDELDLNALVPALTPLQGVLSATASAQGSLAAPIVSARVWSDQIKSGDIVVKAPEVTARMAGGKVDLLGAVELGDRTPTIKALMTLKSPWKLEFRTAGDDVPLSALVPSEAGVLAGRFSWSGTGRFTDRDGLQMKGVVTSDRLGTEWLALDDLSLPFTVSKDVFDLPVGTASIVGAPVIFQARGNLLEMTMNGKLDASAIRVAKLAEPFKLPGRFSGSLALTAKAAFRMEHSLTGGVTGKLTMRDVEVEDVPYMKLLTGGAPIRIRSGLVSFSATPDEALILPGSALTSWPDDTVLNYVAFSGPVWRRTLPTGLRLPKELQAESRDQMRLAINGNINIKALNSLLGGVGVLVQGGMSGADMQDVASNFLQGLLGNVKNQFRDLSFTVAGPYDHLRLDDLQVENSINFPAKDTWATGAGKALNSATGKGTRYGFSFRLPLGPGEGKGKSVGEQATNQILKQIVDSLVRGTQERGGN